MIFAVGKERDGACISTESDGVCGNKETSSHRLPLIPARVHAGTRPPPSHSCLAVNPVANCFWVIGGAQAGQQSPVCSRNGVKRGQTLP